MQGPKRAQAVPKPVVLPVPKALKVVAVVAAVVVVVVVVQGPAPGLMASPAPRALLAQHGRAHLEPPRR